MEKNYDAPARKGRDRSKKLKKIITFFTCVVLIIVSLGMFTLRDFGMGYQYYELQNNQTTMIGVSQQYDLIPQTIEEALAELEEKGFYITSSQLDTDIFAKQAVIQKPRVNDNEIKDTIKKALKVEVCLTKLTIKSDDKSYYFKNESDCVRFVNEMNDIKKVETSIDFVMDNYQLLSSEEVLQEQLDALKAEKKAEEAKAAEVRRAAAAKVTSRGSNTTRSASKGTVKDGTCFPLASYVYISSPYGERHGKMHTGTDFAANSGTHVYAWKSGTVSFTGWSGGYGNFIIVEHSDGTVSRYAHLSGYNCSSGDKVSAGQTIGYVGSTGNSTGPHLHFEIKVNGSFVNPLNYL